MPLDEYIKPVAASLKSLYQTLGIQAPKDLTEYAQKCLKIYASITVSLDMHEKFKEKIISDLEKYQQRLELNSEESKEDDIQLDHTKKNKILKVTLEATIQQKMKRFWEIVKDLAYNINIPGSVREAIRKLRALGDEQTEHYELDEIFSNYLENLIDEEMSDTEAFKEHFSLLVLNTQEIIDRLNYEILQNSQQIKPKNVQLSTNLQAFIREEYKNRVSYIIKIISPKINILVKTIHELQESTRNLLIVTKNFNRYIYVLQIAYDKFTTLYKNELTSIDEAELNIQYALDFLKLIQEIYKEIPCALNQSVTQGIVQLHQVEEELDNLKNSDQGGIFALTAGFASTLIFDNLLKYIQEIAQPNKEALLYELKSIIMAIQNQKTLIFSTDRLISSKEVAISQLQAMINQTQITYLLPAIMYLVYNAQNEDIFAPVDFFAYFFNLERNQQILKAILNMYNSIFLIAPVITKHHDTVMTCNPY